jgi:sugar lactone lactonase YvrE
MLQRVQALPKPMRIGLFVGVALGILLALILVTLAVGVAIVQNSPRLTSVPLVEGFSVSEYMPLPDEDAYPAALAVDAQGTLYTGSYVSGAVWAITTSRAMAEIAGTREQIGSVTGLTVGPDGLVYVLDRISPLQAAGARVWTIAPDETLTLLHDFTGSRADILELPDDIAVDSAGRIYISDRGISPNNDIVYRITPDGVEGVWWQSPPVTNARSYAPTGLAYDAERSLLYITDSTLDILYAVPINPDGSAGDNRILYDRRQGNEASPPGFDGVTVDDQGRVFVAALGTNRIGMYDPNTGLMTYIAGSFRGAADVVYSPLTQRLYVANWDQRSLLPTQVLFVNVETRPHLPFAIDVITPEAAGR